MAEKSTSIRWVVLVVLCMFLLILWESPAQVFSSSSATASHSTINNTAQNAPTPAVIIGSTEPPTPLMPDKENLNKPMPANQFKRIP